MDNGFDLIQVGRFWQQQRNMGHFARIWKLKLHGHFFESKKLIPEEFDVYVRKHFEDAWVSKKVSVQITLRPYITWYSCLSQQNVTILKLHSLLLLKSISYKFNIWTWIFYKLDLKILICYNFHLPPITCYLLNRVKPIFVCFKKIEQAKLLYD